MTTATDTPRVYVACLASYNEGKLFGKWIDVPNDADALQAEITAMLAASPSPYAEEWAIHDTDGIQVTGENPDLEKLCEAAASIAEHGYDAWTAYTECVGVDYATGDGFTESYQGHYEGGMLEFAEQFFRECHDIPQALEFHIDWHSVARAYGYDFFEEKGHVFSR